MCWIARIGLTLGVVAWLSATILTAQRNPIPETYTNLQILPKDSTRAGLVAVMRDFAIQLNVRCQHCHVGEGDDLSTFDFASDARPAKAVARRMLLMVQSINGPLLEGVGEPTSAGAPKVTCFTCHRGSTKPLTK